MSSEPTNARPDLLRPHQPVAERVVCAGDPGRALRLAQALTAGVPAMLNHHRGLWGYSGTATDGAPLTVQATGTGGPSAALVVADLAALGARRLVRVGTAVAADPELEPGALVAATVVHGRDGTSRALGAGDAPVPDAALAAALVAGADRAGPVASADLWPAASASGGLAQDLQSAAFLAAAARASATAAVLLVITRAADGREATGTELEAAELRAGALALAVLTPH